MTLITKFQEVSVTWVQILKQNGSPTFNQSSKPESRFCFGALWCHITIFGTVLGEMIYFIGASSKFEEKLTRPDEIFCLFLLLHVFIPDQPFTLIKPRSKLKVT